MGLLPVCPQLSVGHRKGPRDGDQDHDGQTYIPQETTKGLRLPHPQQGGQDMCHQVCEGPSVMRAGTRLREATGVGRGGDQPPPGYPQLRPGVSLGPRELPVAKQGKWI